MPFRVFLQATFAGKLPTGAQGASDAAHGFVNTLSARGELVEDASYKVLNEKTAYRFRFEAKGPDAIDPTKLRADILALGATITKIGGKVVTLNDGTDSLLAPSDASLSQQLAKMKMLADTRTKQLADSQAQLAAMTKERDDLKAQLSPAAAPTAPAVLPVAGGVHSAG